MTEQTRSKLEEQVRYAKEYGFVEIVVPIKEAEALLEVLRHHPEEITHQ